MKIEERVLLKEIDESELELILNWRNQKQIREVMFNSDLISYEQHLIWYERLQESNTTLSRIFYFDNIPHGVINIHEIDYKNKKCKWGFYIGNREAPKGMGTILGYTALNYIFIDLEMRKLCAEVLDFNKRSIHYHKKLGFIEEGQLRSHIRKNGQYMDVLLFGLFNHEREKKLPLIRMEIEARLL